PTGIELDAAERSLQQLEKLNSAEGFDRPQLHQIESRFEYRFDLGRSGDARKNGQLLLETVIHHGAVESRRDHELGARRLHFLRLGDIEYGAAPREHLRLLSLDALQRLERTPGAQRDLGDRQTTSH